jgi:hypothetical protein
MIFQYWQGQRPRCGCKERAVGNPEKFRIQRGDATQATDEFTVPTSLAFGMLSWAASSKRLSFFFLFRALGGGIPTVGRRIAKHFTQLPIVFKF